MLGSAAAAWPLAARAQPPRSHAAHRRAGGPRRGRSGQETRNAVFRQELERLGWSEGRNVRIDYRFTAGACDRPSVCKRADCSATRCDPRTSTLAAAGLRRESRRSRSCSSASPTRSARASLRAWRGRAAISRACCISRRASSANGWRCSRRSRRASRALLLSAIPRRPPMTTSCKRTSRRVVARDRTCAQSGRRRRRHRARHRVVRARAEWRPGPAAGYHDPLIAISSSRLRPGTACRRSTRSVLRRGRWSHVLRA